jgi:hypothetical protein
MHRFLHMDPRLEDLLKAVNAAIERERATLMDADIAAGHETYLGEGLIEIRDLISADAPWYEIELAIAHVDYDALRREFRKLARKAFRP